MNPFTILGWFVVAAVVGFIFLAGVVFTVALVSAIIRTIRKK